MNFGLKYNANLRHQPGMRMTKWNLGPLFCAYKMVAYDIRGDQGGGTLWDTDWTLWVVPFLFKIEWHTKNTERR